jgi:hypothetical protein
MGSIWEPQHRAAPRWSAKLNSGTRPAIGTGAPQWSHRDRPTSADSPFGHRVATVAMKLPARRPVPAPNITGRGTTNFQPPATTAARVAQSCVQLRSCKVRRGDSILKRSRVTPWFGPAMPGRSSGDVEDERAQ